MIVDVLCAMSIVKMIGSTLVVQASTPKRRDNMRLSTAPHPYYPDDWLDIGKAGQLLHQAGLPSRINMTMCRKAEIEVSSTGHISKSSLNLYIMLKKSDDAEWP
jgi:hypothetical protein